MKKVLTKVALGLSSLCFFMAMAFSYEEVRDGIYQQNFNQQSLDQISAVSEISADGVGNGGGAWICQNQDPLQTIRWIKLLDLYEIEVQYGLPLIDFENLNYQQIVSIMKERLFEIDKTFYEDLGSYFKEVNESITEINASIVTINDALYSFYPPSRDCVGGKVLYGQLANFTNEGIVLIDQYLFNHKNLSERDKAALIFHEVVYAFLRNRYGDRDSIRSRKITGYLFANLADEDIRQRITPILFEDSPSSPSSPSSPRRINIGDLDVEGIVNRAAAYTDQKLASRIEELTSVDENIIPQPRRRNVR